MRPARLFVAVLLLSVRMPGVPAQELTERGTFKRGSFRVDRVELSPDCKVLAAGGRNEREGELKLWSVVTSKEIVSLSGEKNDFDTLAFSADSKRLATGGYKLVRVWDLAAHKQIASFKKVPSPMALSL